VVVVAAGCHTLHTEVVLLPYTSSSPSSSRITSTTCAHDMAATTLVNRVRGLLAATPSHMVLHPPPHRVNVACMAGCPRSCCRGGLAIQQRTARVRFRLRGYVGVNARRKAVSDTQVAECVGRYTVTRRLAIQECDLPRINTSTSTQSATNARCEAPISFQHNHARDTEPRQTSAQCLLTIHQVRAQQPVS